MLESGKGGQGREAPRAVVVGAGPAGLTAALEFARRGWGCSVLEASGTVGGLARTEEHLGCRFDIGGHRFFTKASIVNEIWRELLGEDFLSRPRLSRIYYRSQFFPYPLEPWPTLRQLGLAESIQCGLSFLTGRVTKPSNGEDLETWLTHQFGRRLYESFFKTYTEKVWGTPCSEIRAEWAAQRIRGLSLVSLLANMLTPRCLRKETPKTLIERFHYPRLGPGQMWERAAERAEAMGAQVHLERPVTRIGWSKSGVEWVEGGGERFVGDAYLSSMPIRNLVAALDPVPDDAVRLAGAGLRYRDFLTVGLIVKARDLFPDNWIYVHEPGIRMGRLQNYKNWSPDMVPDPEVTALGCEYFCFEDDSLWRMSDDDLVELARKEVAALGLCDPQLVVGGKVIRVPKAYPVYDGEYARHLERVREFVERVPNLQLVGRNGMHRYNNQDHSMLTAILAARNAMGLGRHDLWKINADEDYHEDGFHLSGDEAAGVEQSQPLVPLTGQAR